MALIAAFINDEAAHFKAFDPSADAGQIMIKCNVVLAI